MSMSLARLRNYLSGQYITKNDVKAEFQNIHDNGINSRPGMPGMWTHFCGDGVYLDTTQKFPQWIVPEDNVPAANVSQGRCTINQLRVYFTDVQDPTHLEQTYDVGIYVNEVLMRTIPLINWSPNYINNPRVSPPLVVQNGDVVRLAITSMADSTHKWKNVTFSLCYIEGPSSDATDYLYPSSMVRPEFSDSVVGAEWNAEEQHIANYINKFGFWHVHHFFFEGEPTTSSRNAMFIVPETWTANPALSGAYAIYHSGGGAGTTTLQIVKNTSTVLGTISLAPTDAADTLVFVDFSESTTAGDTFDVVVSDASGNHQDITVALVFWVSNWSYNPLLPFSTGPYASQDFKDVIDGMCDFFNTLGNVSTDWSWYFSTPVSGQESAILITWGWRTGAVWMDMAGFTITKIKGIFRSGTAANTVTFNVKRNGISIGTLSFTGAGDPINTVKTTDITDIRVNIGDIFTITPTVVTGSQRDITIWLENNVEIVPGG